MKTILNYTLSLIFTVFISFDAKAQLKPGPQKQLPQNLLPDIKPKSLYIQQYLNNPSLSTNAKAEKIGTNELFYFYRLSLDKMICVVPNAEINCLIKIYNPQDSPLYYTDNMPNALPKADLIK